MTITRRRFLMLAGGGTLVAAGAAAGTFAATRRPETALAPWAAAGSAYTEKRRRALSWAILAPNPHNRQPWIVDLLGEDEVALYLDTARLLPETDPEYRQIIIGLGCFLELLTLAAGADGHAVTLSLFPEGEAEALSGKAPVALARFAPGGSADPLFAKAAARRSTKEPFDMSRPVAESALRAPLSAVQTLRADATAESGLTATLRGLALDAFLAETADPAAYRESVEVMRLGRAEIEATPDGIDLGGPFLEGLMAFGLLTRDSLADPSSATYQAGIDSYREIFAATPAFVWLASPDNSRATQIAAGRDWLRLNLATTAAGLALHPVSQALQEYSAMDRYRAEMHRLLGRPGETVQMLGRIGYAAPADPAPRWPLEAKIRHG